MKKLLAFFILATAASSASALRCYVCNSHNESECKDIMPESKNKYLVDCSTIEDGKTYTLCRKIEMSMDMDFGENHPAENRIHRACGYIEDEQERECYYKSGYNTRSWVCTCKTNDCNGATSLSPLGVGIAISLVWSLYTLAKSSHSV